MTRLIDLLATTMPADVWLKLANHLEQELSAQTSLEQRYHAGKVCEILNAQVSV